MTNRKTPYWWGVMAAAKRRVKIGHEPFTRRQIELAASWATCACGKQYKRIARHPNGEPRDLELLTMGSNFGYAVINQKLESAVKCLLSIETRVNHLLECQND